MDSEALVLAGHAVELVLHEDVVGVHVGKDQINFGSVARSTTTEDSLGDLVHGGNASAASDHSKTLDHVGRVSHGALGALGLDSVANLHLSEVLADVSGRVALDENIEMAGGGVIGDGSVRTQNLLVGGDTSLRISDGKSSRQGNVLANWQAKNGVGAGKAEAVDSSVVRQDCLFGQGELLESGGVEHLLNLCWRSSASAFAKKAHGRRLTVVEELVASQSCGNCNGDWHQLLVHQGGSHDQDGRRSVDTLNILRGERPSGLVGVLGRHCEC